MKPSRLAALAAAVLTLAPAYVAAEAPKDPAPAAKAADPIVQIAVLLDTSNSMDGLIAQAKTQLWKVVNEFARAKRNGRAPRLQVALYEYGNSGLNASEGYIRKVVPLTTDLDKISEELFALRTNGGDEYCGQVIDRAARELEWSTDPAALKMIFIAGNEPFTQGPVRPDGAVQGAIKKGIVVNTIFCGPEQEGISTGWRQGALGGDGRYAFIDSNQTVAAVAAPQDAELAKLGAELNKTYVAYGDKGRQAKERQEKQDANASTAGQGAAVTRAVAKASSQYRNEDWDLVDASKGGAKVREMPAAALPAEMQAMDAEQREKYVEEMGKKRAELQQKIAKLESERRTYVAAEEKKRSAEGAATLDRAMLDAVHEQAEAKAYTFE